MCTHALLIPLICRQLPAAFISGILGRQLVFLKQARLGHALTPQGGQKIAEQTSTTIVIYLSYIQYWLYTHC
jgi:hypothetical protein